ncbi:NB-ARC - like 10 [Theobroma cacao]|nr:NB-ARC - like 10 [Theobroma cacao]
MKADKKIEVTCLPEEKAWQLFEEHVGKDLVDIHPNIRDLAQEVAKECGGLPLALITIGRSVANKTTYEEWKYAGDVLRRSSATSISPDMGEECTVLSKPLRRSNIAKFKVERHNMADFGSKSEVFTGIELR